MSRVAVKRSGLAGRAGYGYCASSSRFFWGVYLVCAPVGRCPARSRWVRVRIGGGFIRVKGDAVHRGYVTS